jgi:hypothetical protein
MTFWTRLKILSVSLILMLLIAGCGEKRDIIWGFNETELNPVRMVDVNDVYYEVCENGKHTGWYISNRIMKQVFKVEVK